MDDYDIIDKFNGLKYDLLEIFDNIWFIIFYEIKIKNKKRIAIKIRSFSFCVVHLKGFSPMKRMNDRLL
jgi:hypothetical protein